MRRALGRFGVVFAIAATGLALVSPASSAAPKPPGHNCPNPAEREPSGQCKKVVVAVADVAIEKVFIETRQVGEFLFSFFRVTVTNLGSATADNVVVTDESTTGLAGFLDVPAGTCSFLSRTTGQCNFGSLAPGDTRSFRVQTVYESGTTDTVTATTTSPDSDRTNNVSSATAP